MNPRVTSYLSYWIMGVLIIPMCFFVCLFFLLRWTQGPHADILDRWCKGKLAKWQQTKAVEKPMLAGVATGEWREPRVPGSSKLGSKPPTVRFYPLLPWALVEFYLIWSFKTIQDNYNLKHRRCHANLPVKLNKKIKWIKCTQEIKFDNVATQNINLGIRFVIPTL